MSVAIIDVELCCYFSIIIIIQLVVFVLERRSGRRGPDREFTLQLASIHINTIMFIISKIRIDSPCLLTICSDID